MGAAIGENKLCGGAGSGEYFALCRTVITLMLNRYFHFNGFCGTLASI
jgi:hypothetical protein